MRIITSLILGFSLSLSVVTADTIDGYTFVLDGKPLDPGLLYVNGETLSPGDVVYIGDIPLCLDEPGVYDFQLKEGKVWRLMKDRQPMVVGCEVSFEYDESLPVETRYDTKPKVINPLSGMDDASLKKLRGVSVDIWSDEIAKQLERLDVSHVCLRLQSQAIRDRVPAVPEDVRTLIIDSGGGWGCKEMTAFSRLKKLRFLDLDDAMPPEFDFAVLKGIPLEYLGLPRTDQPLNAGVLGTFKELKTLVANGCSFMGDGRWLAGLTSLRTLYASHLQPASIETLPSPLDLAVLAGLTQLESFHVQSSPVKSLPSTPMPALKRVSLLLSNAPKEAVDAFAKANPQTAISRSMNAQLADKLAKADRVVVRTGGVCHRQESKEKPIHESRDREVITELAAHFTVAESDSGGHCMCCGNPTFEFYDKDTRVAMIAFHHGRSIRWADGSWPGDGMLTDQSSAYLVEWLAKHGYAEPKNELFRGRQQAAAQRRRSDRYQALIPEAVGTDLAKADSMETATAAFEKNVADVKARAALYLRLFGCDDGTWALSTGMDQPLQETWLPGIPEETLRAVILAAPQQSEEGFGSVRWIFGANHVDLVKDDEAALKKLAQFALTHPRQDNRWRTLSVLRGLGTPAAVSVLRTVMREGTSPRALGKDQEVEPGGQMTFYPGNIGLPAGTSDKAAAALCLASIGDQESSAEAKKLRDSLPPKAQKEWDEDVARKPAR